MTRPVAVLAIVAWICVAPGVTDGALSLSAFLAAAGDDWTLAQSENQFSIVGRSAKPVIDVVDGTAIALASAFGGSGVVRLFVSQSHAATHITYVPRLEGEPVENLPMTLSFDHAGFLIGVSGRFQTLDSMKAPPAGSVIAKADVLALLRRGCEFDEVNCVPVSVRQPDERDVVGPFLFATEVGVTRAYRVRLETPRGVAVSEYVVNAIPSDSPILLRREILHPFRAPRGHVFDPNPRAEKGDLRLNESNLGNRRDIYSHVKVRRIDEPITEANEFLLSGRYVELDDGVEDPAGPAVYSNDGSFASKRGDIGFASLMIYVHIDAMQHYVQDLGFKKLLNGAVLADPEFGSENATSILTDGRAVLLFGKKGNVFVAEDGDVIAHEYGHALQREASHGWFDPGPNDFETGAMLEGFADYWAMSYFRRRNRLYAGRALGPECYGEWASQDRCDCQRVVKLSATRCDLQQRPDHHANGSVWTATLWEIAQQIGSRAADELILASHSYVTERPNFCTAAHALLQAERALTKGRRQRILEEIFTARKIIDQNVCKSAALR